MYRYYSFQICETFSRELLAVDINFNTKWHNFSYLCTAQGYNTCVIMVLDKGIRTAKLGIYYIVYRGLKMRPVLPQRLPHILLFMVYFTIHLPETAE
jgi:hypothetical protein